MTLGKKRARRLALYLMSIGVSPIAMVSTYKQWGAAVQTQYTKLGADQRKLARRTGRRLMREFGSVANAIASLRSKAVQQVLAVPPLPAVSRTRTRQDQFLHKSRRWFPLTPPCPSCRMRGGFPKRSWPSREWAEEVLERQHDRDTLRIFKCPVQPGFWHLGHVAQHIASPVIQLASSTPTCQEAAIACVAGGHT